MTIQYSIPAGIPADGSTGGERSDAVPLPGVPTPGELDSPPRVRLWAIVVAMLGCALVATLPSGQHHVRELAARSGTQAPYHPPVPAVSPSPLPAVAPTVYANLHRDQARLSNAAIPFDAAGILPAEPFHYGGTPVDLDSAQTCLAVAALYEAGDDPAGERAVVQTIINRLRHPAFPKTVCGVVFQGAERSTGCQFTFTCDGSLDRPANPAAFKRARAIAAAALGGFVDKTVGTATHYHTNWVVPYWRDSLDKLVAVHTQIFYRWQGWWGSRRAFRDPPAAGEALDPRITAFRDTPVVRNGDGIKLPALALGQAASPASNGLAIEGVTSADLKTNIVRGKDERGGHFVLQLDPAAYPGSFAVVAYAICKNRPFCDVSGWLSASGLPTSASAASTSRGAAFVYQKDARAGAARAMWDCRVFPRTDPAQCLPK